ncbi:MAG: M28 family metallopeptidase [Lutimonas sp.]
MRFLLFFTLVLSLLSCSAKRDLDNNELLLMKKYAEKIDTEDLKEHLYLLASDVLEGRKTGEKGQEMAANYLTAYYKHLELQAPQKYPEYEQTIPAEYFNRAKGKSSENVLAYILGSDFPEEVLVISAHYDHLGMKGELVFNGADDNASGTSAVMEIAEAFQTALEDGHRPKRSILFLHLTGEESGLYGSKYYVSHPVFKIENTVTNLNIDMIGRVDPKHGDKPEYIYLIGSDRLSEELHELAENVNEEYFDLKLDYTFNKENDPNRFYYRSDHYNFAQMGVPVIFFFNGEHEDYHRTTDTPEKINYDLLKLRTEYIFYTAWELANRPDRVAVDPK